MLPESLHPPRTPGGQTSCQGSPQGYLITAVVNFRAHVMPWALRGLCLTKEKLRPRKGASLRPHRFVGRRGPSLAPPALQISLQLLLPPGTLPHQSRPEPRALGLLGLQQPQALPTSLSARAGPGHPPRPSTAAHSTCSEHLRTSPWNNLHPDPDPRTRKVCVGQQRGRAELAAEHN